MNIQIAPDDMHVRKFRKILKRLDTHLPISDEFERQNYQTVGTWWNSQKEHMLSWFKNQMTTGHGQYTRKTPNYSSKLTYSRLLSAPALMWMAEALGEDPILLAFVADEASAEKDHRRKCALIRKHIPWQRIYHLASKQSA